MPIEVAESFVWVWATFGKDLAKAGFNWAKKGFDWTKASMAYAERIVEDYGKVQILGRANRVPLENIYTAVNVLEKPIALRRYSREQLHELFMQRQTLLLEKDKRSDGLELVRTGKNYFILGKPGAGKTTLLKNVAINAVQGFISAAEIPKTPIFISLKAHADSGRTLLESVQHELSICRFPDVEVFVKKLLHSHNTIVLLDGLDEVKQEGEVRSKLIQGIKDFMREYREGQFLITCRVAATEYEFDDVTYIEMADFDDGQIKKFLYNWFDDEDQAKICWQELSKEDNKGLLEMARVPLLLTLLALTYEETQSFPHRRVEIYEEALDALLKKWDSSRLIKRDEPYKHLSLGRKRQMFARIAAETFENNELLIPKADLAEKIARYMQKVPEVEGEVDGQAILESIAAQHGIFAERAKGIYSFAHLSFQEYYVAKYITDNASGGSLEGLLGHTHQSEWREVFLLTSSVLSEEVANHFFKLFYNHVSIEVKEEEKIQVLLNWANQRAARLAKLIPYSQNSLRTWLALDLARSISKSREYSISRDRARELTRFLDINLYRSLALSRFVSKCRDKVRSLSHNGRPTKVMIYCSGG